MAFENKTLKRILWIKQWQKVSRKRVREVTGVQAVDEYNRMSPWKLLGHVFRKGVSQDCTQVGGAWKERKGWTEG